MTRFALVMTLQFAHRPDIISLVFHLRLLSLNKFSLSLKSYQPPPTYLWKLITSLYLHSLHYRWNLHQLPGGLPVPSLFPTQLPDATILEPLSRTHKTHIGSFIFYFSQIHLFLPNSEPLHMIYPLLVPEHSSSPPSLPSYLISTHPSSLKAPLWGATFHVHPHSESFWIIFTAPCVSLLRTVYNWH